MYLHLFLHTLLRILREKWLKFTTAAITMITRTERNLTPESVGEEQSDARRVLSDSGERDLLAPS